MGFKLRRPPFGPVQRGPNRIQLVEIENRFCSLPVAALRATPGSSPLAETPRAWPLFSKAGDMRASIGNSELLRAPLDGLGILINENFVLRM